MLKQDNLDELVALANPELLKIILWFRDNKLSIHFSKMKYILFHNKQKKIPLSHPQVYFNCDPNGVQLTSTLIPLTRVYNENVVPADRTS